MVPLSVGAVHNGSTRSRCHNRRVATRWVVLRDGIRRFVLPAIGIANVVAVATLPIRLTDPLFTHPSTSAAAASAVLIAGLTILGSGLIATVLRPASGLGPLAILASIAWFAPDWIGWQDAPSIIRGLAMVGAPLLGPILLHLVATGSGALRGSTVRVFVVAAYIVTIGLTVGRALVRDPIRDLDCLEPPRNCTNNVFLVWANQDLAQPLVMAQFVVASVIGMSLVVLAVWRLLSGTGPARRSHGPVLVTGAFVGLADATYLITLVADRLATAEDPTLAALFMVRAGAMIALAVAVAWSVTRMRRIGTSVARLASDIDAAPGPGGLEAALALSLGDPGLSVAFRLPTTESFVDSSGLPIPGASAPPGRIATPITRNGQSIALVIHDAGLVDPDELVRTIGSAARLAVDNERLRAEVLAQVRELGASRARIVERADAARRHLERDLHDGAQQRLLALLYELRLGRAAATREGNDDLVAVFERAIGETEAGLEELREIAHGIFPAVLMEAGLGSALDDLADRSAVPVEITGDSGGRCPTASEIAAYVVIEEAVRSAAGRGATHVRLELHRRDGRLTARIVDDGASTNTVSAHLTDRAGAASGRLIDETTGAGQALRLEVPCA